MSLSFKSAMSLLLKYIALSIKTSGIDAAFELITGVPHANASTGGKPKPS